MSRRLEIDESGNPSVWSEPLLVHFADNPGENPCIQSGEELFRRGDSNVDGWIDISDVVFTLLFMFSAGQVPPCLDAADIDDSSQIDVTDAIYSLQLLFKDRPLPPSPALACGPDQTPDDLTCESYLVCD